MLCYRLSSALLMEARHLPTAQASVSYGPMPGCFEVGGLHPYCQVLERARRM